MRGEIGLMMEVGGEYKCIVLVEISKLFMTFMMLFFYGVMLSSDSAYISASIFKSVDPLAQSEPNS